MRLVVGVVVVVVLLSGCVAPGGGDPTPSVSGVSTPSPAVDPTSSDPVEGLPESKLGDEAFFENVRFGETATLQGDQGTITISVPRPFTPSPGVVVKGDWDEFVVMDVTVVNDWENRAPAGWFIKATTGGAAAEVIVDPAQQIGKPDGFIEPGESATYKIGFGRRRGAEFVVSAGSGIAYNRAIFR